MIIRKPCLSKLLLSIFISSTTAELCQWTDWCSFSDCPATECGEVAQATRSRECECSPGQSGGCEGGLQAAFETTDCYGPCEECSECPEVCPDSCKDICATCKENGILCPSHCDQPGNPPPTVEVECSWSEWGEPNACPAVCENPVGTNQVRSRDCVCVTSDGSDLPENSVPNCTGEAHEIVNDCNTGACCEYGDYSDWTPCSQTCTDTKTPGAAAPTKSRTSECTCISDEHSCEPEVETMECGLDEAPPCVTCELVWTDWQECSVECSGGIRRQNRECQCSDGTVDPEGCVDDGAINEEECNNHSCCEVGAWSDWSECDAECEESGKKTRTRSCNCVEGMTGDCGDEPLEETCDCMGDICPKECFPSGWCAWSDWSATCGDASRERSRKCACMQKNNNVPAEEGDCEGHAMEEVEQCSDSEECPLAGCPECAWAGWCPWSDDTATCLNEGDSNPVRSRSRKCSCTIDGEPVDSDSIPETCEGDAEEFEEVTGLPPCKTCAIAGWCEWGECSATCGPDAVRERSRACMCTEGENIVEAGPEDCAGHERTETEPCGDLPECPDEGCQWGEWCPWSSCSNTECGGVRTRTRKCGCLDEDGNADADRCGNPADFEEMISCSEPCECEDCDGNGEDTYSEGGNTTGEEDLDINNNCEGDNCDSDDNDDDECNDADCPADCDENCEDEEGNEGDGSYTSEEACIENCETVAEVATTPAIEIITEDNECRGDNCVEGSGGDEVVTESTKTDCPCDCEDDGVTCKPCPQIECQDGDCSTDPVVEATTIPARFTTPQDCWSNWSDWSECPGMNPECPCGGCGTTSRNRECLCGATPDCPGCDGDADFEEKDCTEEQVTCNLGEWGDWSGCDDQCGAGAMEERTRNCNCPEGVQGCLNGCEGDLREERECGDRTPVCCNWSDWCGWTECSATCDGGIQTRSRKCNCIDWQGEAVPEMEEYECGADSPQFENERCNEQVCEATELITESPIEPTCESKCGDDEECKRQCTDDILDNDKCIVTLWTEWSACHAAEACGGTGERVRHRECQCPPGSTGNCDENLIEREECVSESDACVLPTPPPCEGDNCNEIPCSEEGECGGDNNCECQEGEECECPQQPTEPTPPKDDCHCECPEKPDCPTCPNKVVEEETTTVAAETTDCDNECPEKPNCPDEGEPPKGEPDVTEAPPPAGDPEQPETPQFECDDEDECEGSGSPPSPEDEVPEEPEIYIPPTNECDEPECPNCGDCNNEPELSTQPPIATPQVVVEVTTPEPVECIDDCPTPANPVECTNADKVTEEVPFIEEPGSGVEFEETTEENIPLIDEPEVFVPTNAPATTADETSDCNEETCPPCNRETCPPTEAEITIPAQVVVVTTPKPQMPRCLCPDEVCTEKNCPPPCENNECEEECDDDDDDSQTECDNDDDDCNNDCDDGCDNVDCDNDCTPPVKEECDCSQDCTGTPCEAECLPLAEPVCSWTGYCDWSDCTKECGGRRIRSRDCQCPEGYEGEPDCIGEMFEFDDESCPVCEEGEDVIEAALAPVAEADEYDSYATYY